MSLSVWASVSSGCEVGGGGTVFQMVLLGFLEGSSGAAKKVDMGVKCWRGQSC